MVLEKEREPKNQQRSKQKLISSMMTTKRNIFIHKKLMVGNEQDASPLFLEYKPNKEETKQIIEHNNDQQNIALQQVQCQEYHQQMDMYQKGQKLNCVEYQLPMHQDLYLLLPSIMTKRTS
jgi:hypothetical protein